MEFDVGKIYRRIYAGFIEGRRINSVSVGAEAFFWRLLVLADDFGNIKGDREWLAVNLLPRRPSERANVSGWIDELITAGLLQPYQAEGFEFLAIVDFEKMQKPTSRNGRMRRACPPKPADGAKLVQSAHEAGAKLVQTGCKPGANLCEANTPSRERDPSREREPLREAPLDSRQPNGGAGGDKPKGVDETRRRDDEKKRGAAIGSLLGFGMTASEAKELAERHGPEAVADAIRKTQDRQRKVPIGDIAAYIRTVLAKGGAK